MRTDQPFLQYLEKWILLSTVLGLLTGLIVAIFDYATNLTLWSFFSDFFVRNPLIMIPSLIIGLTSSGLLLSRSSSRTGSGTEEVIDSYHNHEGKLDERSFPKKMLAAVLTIGLGGSAGQEGPSVYAGGVVGSWMWSKLSRLGVTVEDRQILLLAGAAAGIGAIFKAPLTGIIFALEAPFKDDLAHDALVPSLVAAVASYLTLISIDGAQPIFTFPGIRPPTLIDIGASGMLGLLAGICALVFIFTYKRTRTILGRIKRFYVRSLVGAIFLSAIGFISIFWFQRAYPLGISYDIIRLALAPAPFTGALIVIFIMKMLSTSFTLGSTGDGGIFIPQIVMGAALGGFFGRALFPSNIDLFVAVGMASFLAAGYKTPLAAVTFVAETVGPGYLIPSLIAAAVAYSVTGEASVSDFQRLRAKIDITQIADLRASEVMTTNVIAVPAELSALDFVEEYLFRYQHKRFPVVDKEGLIGNISASELREIHRERLSEVKVEDVCNRNIVFAFPDERVQQILDLMYAKNLGRIPIVSRESPKRIVGIVSKSDIIRSLELRRLGTNE